MENKTPSVGAAMVIRRMCELLAGRPLSPLCSFPACACGKASTLVLPNGATPTGRCREYDQAVTVS